MRNSQLKHSFIGMIVGAALFAEVYPWFRANLLKPLDLGKATLPGINGITSWLYFVALAVVAMGLFKWFDQIERRAWQRA